MPKKIRIMIVEADSDFTNTLKSALEKQPDIFVAATCHSTAAALKTAMACQPDIVLLDTNLSDSHMDAIDIAREIRISTESKVLILTSYDDIDAMQDNSVRSFPSGYVFKHQTDLLIQNIRALASGHTAQEFLVMETILATLSPAEKMIFQMMMGENIDLLSSPKTIANQKTGVLKKLGLKSQKELNHIFKIYEK